MADCKQQRQRGGKPTNQRWGHNPCGGCPWIRCPPTPLRSSKEFAGLSHLLSVSLPLILIHSQNGLLLLLILLAALSSSLMCLLVRLSLSVCCCRLPDPSSMWSKDSCAKCKMPCKNHSWPRRPQSPKPTSHTVFLSLAMHYATSGPCFPFMDMF